MTRQIDRAAVATASVMPATRANTPPVADMDEPVAGPRFERQVDHLHQCGPRAVGEFLAEIATATGQPALIAARLEEYARLDPGILRAVGGDRFPPMPLEVIR